MALFMGGELDAVPELGALLAKDDEKQYGPAIETALEVGLLVPEFVFEDKFPALTAKLDEISNTPECRRFSNQLDNAALQSLGRRGTSFSSPDIKPEGEFDVKRPPRLKRPKSSTALPTMPDPAAPGAGAAVSTALRAPSRVTAMPMPGPTTEQTPQPPAKSSTALPVPTASPSSSKNQLSRAQSKAVPVPAAATPAAASNVTPANRAPTRLGIEAL
jgi:hypothetical protein